MHPPDEVMAAVYLPSMRHLVAAKLRSRGLSQSRIASLLGMTQASVSIYLSADLEKAYGQLSRLSVRKDQADRDATILADDVEKGPVHGVATLGRLWAGLIGSGAACAAHREMSPSLADCDFCIRGNGERQGAISDAVSEVTEAAKLLEGSSEFIGVMPEVSVNVACAVPGATAPGEVVAIPGRIVKVRGRARAMLPPEAGASAHMSRVLLLVMSRQPALRACVNVRYDRSMGAILKRRGIRAVTIGRYATARGEDPTAQALERKLATSSERFEAVVDEGAAGIEPNLYLFAKGAREAAELALRLAREYSAR